MSDAAILGPNISQSQSLFAKQQYVLFYKLTIGKKTIGHISLYRIAIKITEISVQGQIFCSSCNSPFQESSSNTNSLTDQIKMRNSAALLNTAHRSTLIISVYLCRGRIYPHYHSGPFPIHLMTFSWSRRYAGHGEVQSAQTGLMLTEALSNSSKSHSLCYIPSQSPPKAN